MNTFGEGDWFNQLDNMQYHMTQNIDECKKNLKIAHYDDSSSNSEPLKEATKTPKQKWQRQQINSNNSNEEDS